MPRSGQGNRLMHIVGSKNLLSRDANMLPAMLAVHFGDVRLKPVAVAIELCMASLRLANFYGVNNFFNSKSTGAKHMTCPSRGEHFHLFYHNCISPYARISFTTRPYTSVSRKSRPAWR